MQVKTDRLSKALPVVMSKTLQEFTTARSYSELFQLLCSSSQVGTARLDELTLPKEADRDDALGEGLGKVLGEALALLSKG
mmetsp:Transcript_6728/g.12542  ORF Transcript_6728/g.12542 Transcript_6728/m.12542 type:complete len:81 (-) Transcript_6728:23-265(-)